METIERIKSAIGIGPKVNVVGRIDLDSINEATHPKKKTKEEREAERQQKKEAQEAYNRDFAIHSLEQKRDKLQEDIRDATTKANELRSDVNNMRNANISERKQQEVRLAYLREKQAVRKRYEDLTLTNDQRQKNLQFYGIRPKKMDVVCFHVPKVGDVEEMTGVALVKDENHYYIAVDMYDQPEQEDNATTLLDENPDGTFEGIWPKCVVLKPAAKFEERYMRNLTDKYADELSKGEEMLALIQQRETDEIAKIEVELKTYTEADSSLNAGEQALTEIETRIKQMNADLLATNAELRRYRAEGTTASDASASDGEGKEPLIDFTFDDADYEPVPGLELDSPVEQLYRHLPYLRGKRQMVTMNWPVIDDDYEPWLRFRLMSNIARVVYMLHKAHSLTYVMSEEYYSELAKRGREYYKGMKSEDVVPHGEAAYGVIVYPSQGYQDTILYRIDNINQLNISVVYLREDRLMFYESYSMQEILGHPRTDHFLCKSMRDSGTEPSRLFSWIRNIVISHLAMEHDMERTVRHLVEEDKGGAVEKDISEDDDIDTADDRDVAMRDYTWYTDITVNREIPVRGYIGHRWCGKGKNKTIKEVWVRPHVKHGYHRDAGVRK